MPSPPLSTFSARDSAGVEIVESHSPSWQAGQQWRVEGFPTLVIDAETDPDLLDLTSPLLLPDGRVVLFNGGNCEIRLHDPDATLLRSAGRCGKGPGEFGRHARIWRWRSDSLLVVDQLNRISVLDADGAYARVLRLPVSTEMPLPLVRGVLDDGTIVLASLRDPVGRATPGIEEGRLEVAVLLRRAYDPVAVEERDIAWLLERRLDQIEGEENRRMVHQAYRDLRHASEMPAFGVPVWPGGSEGGPPMLVDDVGNLWVFEHYRPGEYKNRWSVFGATGSWLGIVDLPPHLSPSQIGEDFVIGAGVGGSGFSQVRRFRMIKPG